MSSVNTYIYNKDRAKMDKGENTFGTQSKKSKGIKYSNKGIF